MSTSQRTFDQVKNILGKLDRNIDAARERRLQTPGRTAPIPMPAPAAAFVAPAPSPAPAAGGTPGINHASTANRSVYGRAQPMRQDARSLPPTGT